MCRRKIIISCEHGGNYIPHEFRYLFTGAAKVLSSHRGLDIGALDVAKYMSRQLSAPLVYQRVSRLLVETNRSIGHAQLFSEYLTDLSPSIKKYLLGKYYHPYRNAIEQKISQLISEGNQVLHLSVHSFTPEFNGVQRKVDIGLLCDENHVLEAEFCQLWKTEIENLLPEKVVMINVPYQGADDGFTTYLRGKYDQDKYLGIELEINQKYADTDEMAVLRSALTNSLSITNQIEPQGHC